MYPPTTAGAPASTIPAPVTALAKMITLHNPDFANSIPTPIPGTSAVAHGRWAIAYDHDAGPSQFGRYGQCGAENRCVGCEIFCETESMAVHVSARSDGRSVLLIENWPTASSASPLRIRTFVPGLPAQSDVWNAAVDPVTAMLVLVNLERGVSAELLPSGRLDFRRGPSAAITGMSAVATMRLWHNLLPSTPLAVGGRP